MSVAGAPARVLRHPDMAAVAAHAAARAVVTLVDALAERREAHLVLTGGSGGHAFSHALAESPSRQAVDWTRVHLWWGDERFVPYDHDERTDTEALADLLPALDVPPTQVHRCPAPPDGHAQGDGGGHELEAAAKTWAQELRAATGGSSPAPAFDVLLLGVGPDGHVASLFPGRPGPSSADSVVAEPESPKPPVQRLSLGLPVLCAARTVLLLVAGEGKAEAVAAGVGGAPLEECPAAHVHGTDRTLWLVDDIAAACLPTRR